ncbi:MAG TPA: protein kinase [Candidatus Polarisedimenticolia bacterium]|nr:protein kinase [Candidatus Polarisedimenticolia bacterium]
MTLSPGKTLSHYRLLEEIGRGGMGVVYQALDTKLDRKVALKVLPEEATADPERLERFRREAKAVAALNHPGIVTIFSVEEAEGVHFLTMELVTGRTLQEIIPGSGLSLDKIYQIAIPLAEALAAAHERGIVHRDLKPSNIIVTPDGRVKVLDFGLAKLLLPKDAIPEGSLEETRTLATGEGKVIGTVPYMSPEQVSGKAVDSRTDIFSLGIILYEMETGKRPFAGESSAELASAILRDQPRSISDIRSDLPGHLGWVTRRCLEKEPRRRYQSALDISNELQDIKSGSSSSDALSGQLIPRSGPGVPGVPAVRPPSGETPVPYQYQVPSQYQSQTPIPYQAQPGPPVKAPTPIRNLVFAGFMACIGLGVVVVIFTRQRPVPAVTINSDGVRVGQGGLLTPPGVPNPPGVPGSHPPGLPGTAPGNIASVAVLPFVNMSSDPDNEYFSDGMTEELINALAKVQGLKVPARTTVFALKGKQVPVQEIGGKLGVATVLEGSVRKAGERIRINVQLVGTSDGNALWSEEYDREVKDVFAVQDEISHRIVDSLKVKLTPTEAQAMERVPASNSKAYEAYLRGRRFHWLGGARNYRAGREMFLKAIDMDPKYPLAWCGLADVASYEYMYSESTPAKLKLANDASQKALELAPDLAESHASRGLALSLSKDYAGAAREFETAIRLDPRLFEAYYFYARSCFAQGLREQAAHLFEQAMKMRPEDYQAPALVRGVYAALGRNAEADEMQRRVVRLVDDQLAANPNDARALYLSAGALVSLGQKEKGFERARRAVAIDPTDTGTLYNVACLYSIDGQKEEAMTYLEKAVANGFAQKAWIENDDDLNNLHDMPRYKALLAKMK